MPEFKNPNQAGGGSSDNRSLLVIMIVMIGTIAGLNWWRSRHEPPAPANPPAVTQSAQQPQSAPSAASPVAQAQAANVTVPAVQAAAESTTVVENELYRITFSNRGGEVRSWILKRYTDNKGKPLDLVQQSAAQLYGYPLSLYTYDPALTKQLAQALYVPSATGTLSAPATLTFKYAAGNLSVTKTFTFGADYILHADTEVLRNGSPIAAPLAWPAGFGDMETAQSFLTATIDTSTGGKSSHEAKPAGGATLNGPFDFAGVADQYFAAVFLPDNPSDATLVTLNNKTAVKDDTKLSPPTGAKGETTVQILGAALGTKSGHVQTRIFAGPKDWQVLGAIPVAGNQNLRSVVDFGFWGYIGEVLFLGLRLVHSWIWHGAYGPHDYSWGWAVVIFTLLIYVVLLPLRISSMKSMLKMQRIQPGIDAIKAKHGNPGPTDPRAAKMNAEVMEYQKSQGVSMLGGCIPQLVQLPLLFAFYTMMTKVVELRHAHFFWLPDLSQADPLHILPIFMVVSLFLMQWYTPTPGVDPAQARMMAFLMPLISGYWTWRYASGLALYWAVSNVVMTVQQLLMNRTALGREIRDLQKQRAADRIAKKQPRTIQGRR